MMTTDTLADRALAAVPTAERVAFMAGQNCPRCHGPFWSGHTHRDGSRNGWCRCGARGPADGRSAP
jgi:hypothetical protein